jgi:hypothetical protein
VLIVFGAVVLYRDWPGLVLRAVIGLVKSSAWYLRHC